ncbi:MAG TPA: hypothetical protein VMF59_13950 [Bacteroidota bacterium]|nr:hypothetical protein [Bacteroidota bacterium]
MRARLAAVVLLVSALCVPLQGNAQERKYDIKSGIITYETTTLEGRLQIAGRVVLYFDDYGRLECKDTYVNGMLKESVLCDGKTVYTLWHDQRIVFRRGPATRGTEVRFDLEALPLSERSEGHVKKLPSMTLAGRVCEAYERTTSEGVIRYAGADHILMYCERNMNGENWVMKAVTVDQTKIIPATKFLPPPGYVERETHF